MIKTSSPTAYCDCWEKCKCKSLIAGDQEKRFKLLDKLLVETNLLQVSNYKSEHLLIYLAQVAGRQIQEQKNYKRHMGNAASRSKTTGYSSESSSSSQACGSGSGSGIGGGGIGDMPQHDLEPPNFARRALERILTDWDSIKQIFLFNYASVDGAEGFQSLFGESSLLFDDSAYVDAQSGSTDLDKFIYTLLVKCPNELLVILVDAIQQKVGLHFFFCQRKYIP